MRAVQRRREEVAEEKSHFFWVACLFAAGAKMEQQTEIWHTVTQPDSDGGGAHKKLSVVSQPECSICFNSYDNVFKTPKQLECTHTFCLECLSRLMAVSQGDQSGGGGSSAEGEGGSGEGHAHLTCPFCRQLTELPDEGPPALTTSREVLCKLPSHQQQEESVWLDGRKLCYKGLSGEGGAAPPGELATYCICIDIGGSGNKAAGGAGGSAARSGRSLGGRLADWKRVLLFIVLMVLLVVIVLWPLQCVFTTGNMRCMRQMPPINLASTTSPPTTLQSRFLSRAVQPL